eukprot:2732234-Rhodomonas_salina.1
MVAGSTAAAALFGLSVAQCADVQPDWAKVSCLPPLLLSSSPPLLSSSPLILSSCLNRSASLLRRECAGQ